MKRLLPALVTACLLGHGISAHAAETLSVAFDTTEVGDKYAPRNVVVVWVETAAGGFVKTLGRWSNARTQHLVAWVAASGLDTDAVSGATRANHTARLTVGWDMLDRNGMPVPNGDYVIRMELADDNSTTPAQNHQGTFAFTRDGVASTQTLQNGGFNNVAMTYSGLDATLCGNGTLDAGETCDPQGSCPTTCAPAVETCVANVLVGAAALCTAECVEQLIEVCVDSDGCCPVGCTSATDSDCGTGGGGGDDPAGSTVTLEGGCAVSATGGAGGVAIVGFALFAVVGRRRRRRS